ncbi:malonate decarboxylase holo-[acyl-carrier-protein] synthase [Pelomonas sp. KK5]|uniref:malonate decarboxylase holo-[acyl-carrier-protein] synthase n=1 Tax=Pelomonas sp. KK5 TaxID=1855730 RepID=UPI00097C16FB|nr:malonate decarboxylase holo-[acyl-carrier-protein] synthase [Pelomonas sp. KK5]
MPPPLHRHQLLRLSDAGWRRQLARPWDDEARACLAHWARARLPVVVTVQTDAPGIAAGIAAPLAWSRRRLVLRVEPDEVLFSDEFPPLAAFAARPAWRGLAASLAAAGIRARVYGSHGWQQLTGLRYVHARSDLDLLLMVADEAEAGRAIELLRTFEGPRLDGELAFPDGHAAAWREWRDWTEGRHRLLLLKTLQGPLLREREEAAA